MGASPSRGQSPPLKWRRVLHQTTFLSQDTSQVYFKVWSFPFGASLVAQMVKNLPVMKETWVQSLAGDDPLEEGMATHSSILAWKIPWTEEPGGLQSIGLQSQT